MLFMLNRKLFSHILLRDGSSKPIGRLVSDLHPSNSSMYGSPLYKGVEPNIDKVERAQKWHCHIVLRLDRTGHVAPYLKKLHWLPIQHQILFQYNLLVFNSINFSQPPYLSALIKSSSRTCGNRLSVYSTHPKKHIGRRGFAVAAPVEWNRLPQTVRFQQTINGLMVPPTLVIHLAGTFLVLTHVCPWTTPSWT